MSGIMLNVVGGTFTAPVPTIGQAYGGGFFAGQISTAGNGIADFNLVVGPNSSAYSSSIKYKNASTDTPGAASLFDGAQNTADIVADGNSTTYPAAHFCNDLVIGGFSDWYMPSINEVEICYYNLKPNTTSNNTSYGANTNAVPSRSSNHTSGDPAQTSATAFQSGADVEEFATPNIFYWASTEFNASSAWIYDFNDGSRFDELKNTLRRVRAIRRVAV